MDINFCKSCEKDFEDDEEVFRLEELSDYSYCLECFEDLKDECPRCGGRGCDYCLMTD